MLCLFPVIICVHLTNEYVTLLDAPIPARRSRDYKSYLPRPLLSFGDGTVGETGTVTLNCAGRCRDHGSREILLFHVAMFRFSLVAVNLCAGPFWTIARSTEYDPRHCRE